MFASNLERILSYLCEHADAGAIPDMAQRFESLRGYGRLPKGRENRSNRLTSTQIAHAVLGLTPVNPTWAGHSAVVLGGLMPVGGKAASMLGAPTLAAAVELLCTSDEARAKLVSVTLSMAESGVNNAGFGTILVREGERQRHIGFVSWLATSMLRTGAEASFDPDLRFGRVSRELTLNRHFFDKLADQIQESARWVEPAGDGSEYDDDDALRARLSALGVVAGSRFLNVGVNTQVTWPRQEMLVRFDKYQLVLMPKTAKYTQSVHVDLTTNRLTNEEAMTVVNRFLSVMAWCSDQFAIFEGGWTGNPLPLPVQRRDLAFATASHWIFDRRIPATNEMCRALAHYREALNANEASLISYAVLSYFKIIELRHEKGPDVRKWIAENIGAALATSRSDQMAKQFNDALGGEAPEEYLWKACRVAVAHGSAKRPSDADELKEVRRLHVASGIMQRLARRFIEVDLGVSDSLFSGT